MTRAQFENEIQKIQIRQEQARRGGVIGIGINNPRRWAGTLLEWIKPYDCCVKFLAEIDDEIQVVYVHYEDIESLT